LDKLEGSSADGLRSWSGLETSPRGEAEGAGLIQQCRGGRTATLGPARGYGAGGAKLCSLERDGGMKDSRHQVKREGWAGFKDGRGLRTGCFVTWRAGSWADCPGRLRCPHLWRFSRPGWVNP